MELCVECCALLLCWGLAGDGHLIWGRIRTVDCGGVVVGRVSRAEGAILNRGGGVLCRGRAVGGVGQGLVGLCV